jgi:hypothetical protein
MFSKKFWILVYMELRRIECVSLSLPTLHSVLSQTGRTARHYRCRCAAAVQVLANVWVQFVILALFWGHVSTAEYVHTPRCILMQPQAKLRDAEAAAELARTTAAQEAKSTTDTTAKLEADLQVQ